MTPLSKVADFSENKAMSCSVSVVDIFLSVGEDMDNIMDRVTKIIPKLDAAVLRLTVHEESAGAAVRQESRDKDASCQTEDIRNPQSESSLELKEEVQDVCDQKNMLDSGFNSSNCGKEKDIEGEPHIRGQKRDFHYQACLLEAEEKDRENKTEKGNEEKWVTVRAPADGLRFEVDDALSCLMVSGSEELVSRVICVKVRAGDTFHFPVTVAVPFCLRHRSSHREVAVKFVDEEKRESYITPVTTDGARGGQKGCFAEVKVYSLGIFAVVSCLKRETYNVSKRGLSLKLPMDPRICLNYLPGSFTVPVMAQTM
ncbi:hypothetical protein ATANTOWER_022013, partial [Ataeniobius toweri]|nr:hypothetical protein [Ataeniobius toweri]